MASPFLLALSLSLLVSCAFAERSTIPRLSQEQQCRFQRISAAQPRRRLQSEGGVTELWEETLPQFQCAGIAAMRNILRPNALSLPNYHPSPRLVYIEKGQGFIGITFPGCVETFEGHKSQFTRERVVEQQHGDMHQKVHRIRQGDIVALPAGAVHWCFNDGNDDLIAVSVNDLNHQSNQLDQKFRAFYLAGGVRRSEQQEQGEQKFHNIFRAFDASLMAEAFNVPEEIIRRMQSEEEERGLSVIVREPMRFIVPEEEEEEQFRRRPSSEYSKNGIEETFCSMNIRTNIEKTRDADIFSRQAGKLNVVDMHKLPILKFMDMSAEKGNLYPNALLSPHWATLGHSVVYVTRGGAQIQIVDQKGQALMNDRVNEGDMLVVPQFYTSTAQAGNEGFEWVAFRTSGWPMRNPMAGYTSVMRAMPLQVITNAYEMSPKEGQALKMNRGSQSYLLSPLHGKQY